MLRMALQTDKGPIGIVGINDENIKRMRAGMSLDINLKEMTPPDTQIDRLLIHLGTTYEQVVDDLVAGGISVPDGLRKQARDLDALVERKPE